MSKTILSERPWLEATRHVAIPEDVERVVYDQPCFNCGTARKPCPHRNWS